MLPGEKDQDPCSADARPGLFCPYVVPALTAQAHPEPSITHSKVLAPIWGCWRSPGAAELFWKSLPIVHSQVQPSSCKSHGTTISRLASFLMCQPAIPQSTATSLRIYVLFLLASPSLWGLPLCCATWILKRLKMGNLAIFSQPALFADEICGFECLQPVNSALEIKEKIIPLGVRP